MAAGIHNILLEEGSSFQRILTVESDPGTPINLTGYTFAAKMKLKVTDPSPALTFTIAVSNAAAGQVLWTATSNQTLALTPQVHHYDVDMTHSGTTTRILEGLAWVSPSINA
jgi:hypothetical protein